MKAVIAPLSAVPNLSVASSELQIADFIDRVRQSELHVDDLIAILSHNHPLYAERGTNQIVRIRGYALASFELKGLPEEAFPFVFEVLQSSQSAYLVAAAAKAIRGISAPVETHINYLLQAVENIQYKDDALSFESYFSDWPRAEFTTALDEILNSLMIFGARARSAVPVLKRMSKSDVFNRGIQEKALKAITQIEGQDRVSEKPCCGSKSRPVSLAHAQRAPSKSGDISGLVLENQHGQKQRVQEALFARPTVAAFFYTRCSNPNKCSLTITMLGDVQRLLCERGLQDRVSVAAISYDPGYDAPDRLLGYCENRKFVFDQLNNAWRCAPDVMNDIRSYFDLGASYSGSLVSQHQIEAYILKPDGEIAAAFTRMQWRAEELCDTASRLIVD